MHLIRLQFEICTIMREYKFVTHFSHKRLLLEDSVTCLTKIDRSGTPWLDKQKNIHVHTSVCIPTCMSSILPITHPPYTGNGVSRHALLALSLQSLFLPPSAVTIITIKLGLPAYYIDNLSHF